MIASSQSSFQVEIAYFLLHQLISPSRPITLLRLSLSLLIASIVLIGQLNVTIVTLSLANTVFVTAVMIIMYFKYSEFKETNITGWLELIPTMLNQIPELAKRVSYISILISLLLQAVQDLISIIFFIGIIKLSSQLIIYVM